MVLKAFNMLNKKVFGGNVMLKLDIKNAFDTLDWSFLLEVLEALVLMRYLAIGSM